MSDSDLWKGLEAGARARLSQRDYSQKSFPQRLATSGVEVRELLAADRSQADIAAAWIPGVEFFSRRIFPQRQRGFFGEFARRDEGILAKIGLWPTQWATARMFSGTAKGFHIHPPHIPEGTAPEAWFKRLFIDEPANYSLRHYDKEQWDVMFFIQGNVEMILVDERAGMPRRVMRYIIEGDDLRGPNNAAVIIPSGVAHALRAEGSQDLIMVYGTSTKFEPAFEGRIASDVESAPLPAEWQGYIEGK
jgi:dTDP-4-dehydrorhamnose 3,5-epimerase-like enzyme